MSEEAVVYHGESLERTNLEGSFSMDPKRINNYKPIESCQLEIDTDNFLASFRCHVREGESAGCCRLPSSFIGPKGSEVSLLKIHLHNFPAIFRSSYQKLPEIYRHQSLVEDFTQIRNYRGATDS